MICIKTILMLFSMSLLFFFGQGQPPELKFTEGPKQISLGSNDIASVDLPQGYLFLDKAGAQTMLRMMSEPAEENILGAIVSANEETNWFVLITYDDIGYMKDDEADRLDADDLLESIQEGTEEANKEREKMGGTPFHVVGWYKKPTYQRTTHTLSWSIIGKGDQSPEETVNMLSIVLGRYGILSLVMVGGMQDAALLQKELDQISQFTRFNQGRDYASFVSGDRLADITMTGLITGGSAAGAYALAKTGLLAKFGKLLIIPAIALFAFLKNLLSRFFARRGETT